jgi:hypothetical protein
MVSWLAALLHAGQRVSHAAPRPRLLVVLGAPPHQEDDGDGIPEDKEDSDDQGSDGGRPSVAVDEIDRQPDHSTHCHSKKPCADQREPGGDPQKLFLVVLAPKDAMLCSRRHEACRRERRGDDRRREDGPVPGPQFLEPLAEGHDKQEGEQDLNTWKCNAELIEQLDELTISFRLGHLPYLNYAPRGRARRHDIRNRDWGEDSPAALLGSGHRLFKDRILPATMRPVELTVTDLGIVLGTYEPACLVRHGKMEPVPDALRRRTRSGGGEHAGRQGAAPV